MLSFIRVTLQPDPQGARRRLSFHSGQSLSMGPQSPTPQWFTSSNKAIPPKSSTSHGSTIFKPPHFLKNKILYFWTKRHLRHRLFIYCGERWTHICLCMCMEATGEYLQLPFILLSSSLFWDNILNQALVWVWVGWLSSKPQGLSFISLSRARTAGIGHHTWLSRWCWRSAHRSSRVHATKHQVTLQLLIYCLLVLVCPSCEYFHSSKIEQGVLGDPISLQCLSQNDFSGSVISYRITAEFDSRIVHLKQNKVLLPLFWGRCSLFLLRLSSEQWKSVFQELMVEFKMLPSEIGLTKWVCYFNTLVLTHQLTKAGG